MATACGINSSPSRMPMSNSGDKSSTNFPANGFAMTAMAATRDTGLAAGPPASDRTISLTNITLRASIAGLSQRVVCRAPTPGSEMTGNWTACKGRRQPVGFAAIVLVGAALLAGIGQAGGSEDDAVTLSIANESPEPLRCTILFAHFVSKDVGTIAPRAEVSLSIFRQKDGGALWIPRADGRK